MSPGSPSACASCTAGTPADAILTALRPLPWFAHTCKPDMSSPVTPREIWGCYSQGCAGCASLIAPLPNEPTCGSFARLQLRLWQCKGGNTLLQQGKWGAL